MNKYYVDPSVSTNGIGTIESPFNSIDNAIAAGIQHPFTLHLKAGTVSKFSYSNNTTNSFFNNKTTVQSVITRYGVGKKPILTSDNNVRILDAWVCQLKLEDLQVSPMPGSERTAIYFNVVPIGNKSNENICNFTLNRIDFIGTTESIAGSNGKSRVFCLNALADYGGSTNVAHKILVSNCRFDMLNAGIQIRGNPRLSDTTTYHGDQMKSYGVRVINCSFTNIINSSVFLGWCASKNQSRDVINDDMESGVDGIYHSSYRYNVYDLVTKTAAADVPVWFSGARYLTFQNFEIHGAGPGYPDRQSFDFDYHCHYCLARYGFTSNNARGPMFIQGPFSNSWYSSQGYTPLSSDIYTLYFTLGFGCIGNVIEYVVSYNDGVGRTNRSSDTYWIKTAAYRYVYDCLVRNCVFIDTVSSGNEWVIDVNPQADDSPTALSMTIDSCLFYWSNRTGTDVISSATVARIGDLFAKFKLKNNLFFSEKWGGATPTFTKILTENNKFVSPKFKNGVQMATPAGIREVKELVRLMSTSPCISSGSPNANLDIWGNAGSNIGWEQS